MGKEVAGDNVAVAVGEIAIAFYINKIPPY